MVQDNTHNETEVRRFLLGEMPENERSAFEARFVADESLFEQISATEDELIESYVRGTLSTAEQTIFEREFLSTEPRRRRVAFTRAMLNKINKESKLAAVKKTEPANAAQPSVFDSIKNLFKTPTLAFGAVAVALIAVFGVWILLKNSNQTEIAKQTTPTPTAETGNQNLNQSQSANQNDAPSQNINAAQNASENTNGVPNASQVIENQNQNANRNSNSNSKKQNSVAPAPVLALFAGTVRSEGKTNSLDLPRNASGATLQLNLESVDYRNYSVEIVDPDGARIFVNNNLKPRGKKINFFVPAARIATGDYIVKLSARNSGNETESVADYTFRVKRQ